jgi:hypothetical protein
VAAARADGLDWITVTDHSSGPDNTHAQRAYEEAAESGRRQGLLVLPGEEFTSGNVYHANVINGTVGVDSDVSLARLVEAVRATSSETRPVTVKWNHPGNGAGVPISDLERLPLIEVRMRDAGNSQTVDLWWSLLDRGLRIFAESSSDSHHVAGGQLGDHRTYVHLGDRPLTAANVVRALAEGRSFVSRGAVLYLTANGALPGSNLRAASLDFDVEAAAAGPLARVELIHRGAVVHTFDAGGGKRVRGRATLPARAGWYLARVIGPGAASPVLAMTNPVFVE